MVKGSRKLTGTQISEAAGLHSTGLPIKLIAPRYAISNVNLGKLLRRRGFHVDSIREASARKRRRCDDRFFESLDSEEKAYWAGFITADGCVTHNRTSLVLSLSVAVSDGEHLSKFLMSVNSANSVNICKGQATVCLYSEQLCRDLTRHGIGPRKTGREQMPELAQNLRRHFIRGYFDGDGWWSIGKPGWEASGFCGGATILQQIREWIGLNVCEAGCPKIAAVPGMYRLVYTGGRQVRAIARALYKESTVSLQRKLLVAGIILARERQRQTGVKI